MRLKIQKKEVLKRIQHLSSIAPIKNAMPILTNYKIVADSELNRISITATDLEVTATASFEANIIEGGIVAVSAKGFNDIINAMPDSEITLESDNQTLLIHSGDIDFNLLCTDHNYYPITPTIQYENAIDIDAKVFRRMVKNTSFAVSTEITRPIFKGVSWQIYSDYQLMASSDGKRITENVVRKSYEISEGRDIIITPKNLQLIAKIIEDSENVLRIIPEENKIIFLYQDFTVISNIITGKFPKYEKVFDNKSDNILKIRRRELENAIKRVSLILGDELPRVKVDFSKNVIMITSLNREFGDAKEVLKDFEYSGEPLSIGINFKYFLSIVEIIESEHVLINLGTGKTAMLFFNTEDITEYESRYLLMPLSVDKG